METDDSLVH